MYYTVKERVRWLLRENNLRASKDLFRALDNKIDVMLKDACERTRSNKRTTVMPYDV